MPNLLHVMPKLTRNQQSLLVSIINVFNKPSLRWDFKYDCCPELGFYPKAKALEALDKWLQRQPGERHITEVVDIRNIKNIKEAINS